MIDLDAREVLEKLASGVLDIDAAERLVGKMRGYAIRRDPHTFAAA